MELHLDIPAIILVCAALIIAELGVIVRQVTRRPSPDVAGLSQAEADVIAERRRQVTGYGWSPEHDDEHKPGDLATAGYCYALCAVEEQDLCVAPDAPPRCWPWDLRWWKPNGVRRALVKAAALIIAEIDKIDRKAAKTGGGA